MGSFLRPGIWREYLVQPRLVMDVLLTKAVSLLRLELSPEPVLVSEALIMSGHLP
jgi:hypothetical protein